MALGIYINGEYKTPDRGLTRKIQHKTLTQSFGDGYEQRIVDGINSLQEQFSVTFNNRTKEEATQIANYFESTKNVISFVLVVPSATVAGLEESIKVICQEFTLTYAYDDFYTVQASLKRVYE